MDASVGELSRLMLGIDSSETRAHAATTLEVLRSLSRDGSLQADCSLALIALKSHTPSVRASTVPGIANARRGVLAMPSASVNPSK
jgi:hypothetical protein